MADRHRRAATLPPRWMQQALAWRIAGEGLMIDVARSPLAKWTVPQITETVGLDGSKSKQTGGTGG